MRHKKIYQMTLAAFMTAVLCVFAPLSVAVGPVSVTLQNFVIGIAVIVLGWKLAFVSCAIYLLLGLVGMPVFSGFGAGAGQLFGPSGGYLIGFLFFVLVSGMIIETVGKTCRRMKGVLAMTVFALVVGDTVLYVFGTVWFSMQQQVPIATALTWCVIPFLFPDVVKLVLAAVVGWTVKYGIRRAGLER